MKNPKLISKPFAQNGQKNVIPEKYETSMESNQATWDQGFGQITMLPVSAGGLPPKGQDFNGILNQMCETIVHISKGGVFKFSVDYATAINGYPKGAILQSEDEKKYYQSLIDNNKVNFNTASQDQIKTSWKLVMTDDLLDQLSKKLESSAVVQSTGSSTTSVMSQKASTDAFQGKGDYLKTGDFGVGGDAVNIPSSGFDGISKTGVYKGTGVGVPPGDLAWGSVIHLQRQVGRATQIAFWKGELATRSCIDGVWDEWISFYSDTNTSKDSNGFLRTGSKTTLTTDKISQGIGISPEHVMSQKASTEYFALSKYFDYLSSAGEGRVWSGDRKNYLFTNNNKNSGLYNTDSDGYIWGFNSSGVMTAGMIPLNCGGTGARDIASAQNNLQVYSKGYINTELDKKFDKSKISQGIGPSTEHVMSQKACVDSFQPKGNYQPAGNYALKGESYTKSESDNRYPLKSDVYSKLASDDKYGLKNTANKAESGWWKCGDTGLIYQWGKVSGSTSDTDTRNFPIKFPNKCLIMLGSYIGNDWGVGVGCVIKSSSTFLQINHAANASWSGIESNFLAIGY